MQLIAEEARVDFLLVGSYVKAGELFRITTKLHHMSSGRVSATKTTEAPEEGKIFDTIDELSQSIKSNFDLSDEELADDMDENIGKITTSSPEAFSHYIQGRKYYRTGEHDQSIQMMQKALEIDPDFAMAHWSMAQSYANLGFVPGGYYEKYKEHIEHALSNSDRISERERLLIQAEYHTTRDKTWPQAIDTYKTMLIRYPNDIQAHMKIGYLYFSTEQWELTINHYKYCVNQLVNNRWANSYLAYAYNRMDHFEDARQILEQYKTNINDEKWIHMTMSNLLIERGELDAAQLEIEKASSFSEEDKRELILLGDIAMYKGDFENAKKYYDAYGEQDIPAIQQHHLWLIAYLDLHQGKYQDFVKRVRYFLDFKIREDNEARKVLQ